MGSAPHVHIRARFDGKVFVPEQPIELPKGTILDGWLLPVSDKWPPGFIERTIGAWDGPDIADGPYEMLTPQEPKGIEQLFALADKMGLRSDGPRLTREEANESQTSAPDRLH